MLIEYIGKQPATFRRLGSLTPGDQRDIPDERALVLISQGEFRAVVESKKREKPTEIAEEE